MKNSHKLVSIIAYNGREFTYAVCRDCFSACEDIERESAEKISDLEENCLAQKNVPERDCHYCGHEIVVHEPDWAEISRYSF